MRCWLGWYRHMSQDAAALWLEGCKYSRSLETILVGEGIGWGGGNHSFIWEKRNSTHDLIIFVDKQSSTTHRHPQKI